MTRSLFLAFLMTAWAQGIEPQMAEPKVELQTLEHKVLYDNRTYHRDVTDRRQNIWTFDQDKAIQLLKDFGIAVPDFKLREGEVFVIFMNDNITEDLIQVVNKKGTTKTFADYADSGIRFRLVPLEDGKKYSHVTAVVFTPVGIPSNFGMRGMISGGLSEKR